MCSARPDATSLMTDARDSAVYLKVVKLYCFHSFDFEIHMCPRFPVRLKFLADQ